MSFSLEAKEELVRMPLGKSCCILRELSALVQTSASLSLRGAGRFRLTFKVENAGLARRIFLLCRAKLGTAPTLHFVTHPRLGGRRTCVLTLDGESAQQLMLLLRMMEEDAEGGTSFKRTVPRCQVTRLCCTKAFLRAAFLGSGSISNPEKGYHLEFISQEEQLTQMLLKLLSRLGITGHVSQRKNQQVIYIKDSDQIVTLLGQIGAHKALMELENIRAQKNVKNQVNRMMNCDHGNMEKQLDAAQNQVRLIEDLALARGLDSLPPSLAEMAKLRLSRPDASLVELGQMAQPPIGKSGVNHRIRRLMELARQLPEQKGEET